jgi:hypothetical protein
MGHAPLDVLPHGGKWCGTLDKSNNNETHLNGAAAGLDSSSSARPIDGGGEFAAGLGRMRSSIPDMNDVRKDIVAGVSTVRYGGGVVRWIKAIKWRPSKSYFFVFRGQNRQTYTKICVYFLKFAPLPTVLAKKHRSSVCFRGVRDSVRSGQKSADATAAAIRPPFIP